MREPTISGTVAKAWRMPLTEAQSEAHRREFGYDHAGIDQWFVNGPYHNVWNWWYIGCIHLREVAGAPPSKKHYPEAEYEFFIWSLGKAPNIEDIEAGVLGSIDFLHPPDVIFHFHGVTDDQARALVDEAVHLICGGMSPDSDFRSWWLRWLKEKAPR